MIIIWGVRVRRRPLGWVAECDPLLGIIAPMHLIAVEHVTHLFWIPVGPAPRAERRNHHVLRTADGAACYTARQSYATPFSTPPDEVTADFIDRTNPRLAERCTIVAEHRQRLAALPQGDDARVAALDAMLTACDRTVPDERERGHSESVIAVIAFVAIVLTFAATILWSDRHALGKPLAGAAAAIWILTVLSITIGQRRSAAKRLLPRLAPAMRELRPSREEVLLALDQRRRARAPAAACFTPDQLLATAAP